MNVDVEKIYIYKSDICVKHLSIFAIYVFNEVFICDIVLKNELRLDVTA